MGNCTAGNRTNEPVTAPSSRLKLSMQSKAFSMRLTLSYSESIAHKYVLKAERILGHFQGRHGTSKDLCCTGVLCLLPRNE